MLSEPQAASMVGVIGGGGAGEGAGAGLGNVPGSRHGSDVGDTGRSGVLCGIGGGNGIGDGSGAGIGSSGMGGGRSGGGAGSTTFMAVPRKFNGDR